MQNHLQRMQGIKGIHNYQENWEFMPRASSIPLAEALFL